MQKEIDARGMRCPRPIIELAKARRSLKSGDEISIKADDPAFESDLKAWCDATGCRLKKVDKEGSAITAVIEIG